jgi:hypothetical protein
MLDVKQEFIANRSEPVNFVKLGYLLKHSTAKATSVITVIRLVFLKYLYQ